MKKETIFVCVIPYKGFIENSFLNAGCNGRTVLFYFPVFRVQDTDSRLRFKKISDFFKIKKAS
jgi:hypothetical protein